MNCKRAYNELGMNNNIDDSKMSKNEVMDAQCEAVKSVSAIETEPTIFDNTSKKSWTELRAVVHVTRRVISEMCTTAVPSSITFRSLPDGRTRIYFLSTPSNGWETTLLYADVTYSDHADGCRLHWQPIIEANFQSIFYSVSNTSRLSREEQLLSERKRLAHFGITSYELHVPSGKLVFPAASSIYQCVDNAFMPGPLFPSELRMSASGAKLCPQICPWDSNLIAHTCSGDIHLSNNVTGSSIRLTHARKGNVSIAEDPLTAGTPSYVMQEEFTRYIGYWWQPKSNDGVYRIVYEEVDETDVKIVCFPSSCTSAEDIDEFRFPQAGTCNAHSNLKLLQFRDASNLQDEDIEIFELKNNLHNLFPWMEYLVRVGWTPDGQRIWAQLLDRKQQRLELILIPLECFSEPSKNNSMSSDLYSYSVDSTDNNHFSHPSENIQVLYSESSSIWINIDDLLYFLPSDDPMEVKFIWGSEETKFRHLYLVTSSLASGTSNGVEEPVERMSDIYLKPRIVSKVTLTQGEWEVLGKKLWVDETHSIVYFSGLREGPLEEHVYAVSLHRPMEIRLLTRPGYSYNSVYFNQDCSMMVAVYSSTKSAPVCQVFRITQSDWTVDSINLTPVGYLLEPSITPLECLKPEIHTHKISSGDTIYAMIFKPFNYEPGIKYPTILNIYGGPAVQLVSNTFKGMRHLRMHMLASQGYCVVVIDSRGSHHRGVVFESYLRRRMGTVELHDQVEVLKWLAETTDCIDMNRVALHGWSYGGYLSLMGLIQYPDVFKLVIAGAPVTSWNYYDTETEKRNRVNCMFTDAPRMSHRYQFACVTRDLVLSRTARASRQTAATAAAAGRSTIIISSTPPRNSSSRNTSLLSSMADINLARKMSAGFNGKINGHETKRPFLIGVSGGTASGKSTVCKRIMEKLGQVDMEQMQRQVVCISLDSFYRDLTPEEKTKAEKGQYNFDHPDAINDELIYQTLMDILAGKKCEIPTYDYRTNSIIKDKTTIIYPADVVLFEGILVFYFSNIRNLFHMKLFVDTDSDTRLARRVPRDINERGRDLDTVLNQYINFVKPAFEEFCLPTKKYADVIIPRGADNTVAIDLIVQHIKDLLSHRGKITIEPESPMKATRPH